MKRLIASLALAVLVIAGVALAMQHNKTDGNDAGKLHVVATYYPLYEFARQVGGDKVRVTSQTPAGTEPHDYEPSPKSLVAAHKAAVFIYNGAGLEPWVAPFLAEYKHTAVQASQDINLLAAADAAHPDEMVYDPHFWIDPVLAQTVVGTIRDGLSKADPANSEYYAQNAARYTAALAQLDAAYRDGLRMCSLHTVVSAHEAFGYLGKRYGFTAVAIAGMSPEAEPSAAKLAEISDIVTEQQLQYVFFERLVSPRLAATIAAETDAKTLVFDPIEGLTDADQKQGKNYLSIQRENLASLRTALACR